MKDFFPNLFSSMKIISLGGQKINTNKTQQDIVPQYKHKYKDAHPKEI